MTELTLQELKHQLCHRASRAIVGGFRPPADPFASWLGKVKLAAAGEDWPTSAGRPMMVKSDDTGPFWVARVTRKGERRPRYKNGRFDHLSWFFTNFSRWLGQEITSSPKNSLWSLCVLS